MSTVMHRVMHTANRIGVGVYRRSGGRLGGRGAGGVRVLLLTVPGRRTGQPRTTPVGYFDHEGGYLVVGSGGGMEHDPDWFKNLRKAPVAMVQIGRNTFPASARVLAGEERDTAFRDVVVAQVPRFADYERKSGRTMPLALLTPLPE
jgi:deazaflavin-dependent oxidoreductase (nitroreductase family)